MSRRLASASLGFVLGRVKAGMLGAGAVLGAAKADPKSFSAHYNLGVLLALKSTLPEAAAELGRAVELRPTDAPAGC